MESGYTQRKDIYKIETHIKRNHTWKWNLYRDEIHINREYIQK